MFWCPGSQLLVSHEPIKRQRAFSVGFFLLPPPLPLSCGFLYDRKNASQGVSSGVMMAGVTGSAQSRDRRAGEVHVRASPGGRGDRGGFAGRRAAGREWSGPGSQSAAVAPSPDGRRASSFVKCPFRLWSGTLNTACGH